MAQNSNLRNIRIVFIVTNVIFQVSSSKKNFMDPFRFNCIKSTEPLQGGSLLSSEKFLVPFDQPRKVERLTRPCSHTVALNTGPLNWESSVLNNRPVFVFALLIFSESAICHMRINYFVRVGSRGIIQSSALKTVFFVLFFLKCIKKKHFRSTWAE